MKHCRLLLALSFTLLLAVPLAAQEDAPGRIPVYPVPYEYPTEEGIMEVLHRVRGYYESTGPQTVIDTESGEAMADVYRHGMQTVRQTDGFADRQMAHAARYSWDASAAGYRQVYEAITRATQLSGSGQPPLSPPSQDAACAV